MGPMIDSEREPSKKFFISLFEGEHLTTEQFAKKWEDSEFRDMPLGRFIFYKDYWHFYEKARAPQDVNSFYCKFLNVPGNKYSGDDVKKRNGDEVSAKTVLEDFAEAARYANSVGVKIPTLLELIDQKKAAIDLEVDLVKERKTLQPDGDFNTKPVAEFLRSQTTNQNSVRFMLAIIYFMYNTKGYSMDSLLHHER